MRLALLEAGDCVAGALKLAARLAERTVDGLLPERLECVVCRCIVDVGALRRAARVHVGHALRASKHKRRRARTHAVFFAVT